MHIARALYDAGDTPARAARQLMKAHGVAKKLPPRQDNADRAFFGGRVQIFRTGTFEGPLYRYDMRSAYPAALVYLKQVFGAKVVRRSWENVKCELLPWAFREEEGTVGYPPFGISYNWSYIKSGRNLAQPGPFDYLVELYALAREYEGIDADFASWMKQAMRCTWGNLLLPGFECYSLEWAGLATQIVHDWIYSAVCWSDIALLSWNVDSVTLTRQSAALNDACSNRMGGFRRTVLDRLVIDPGAFGPRLGHPEPGTDRWNAYWPTVEFRDPKQESAPYVYRGGNPSGVSYEEFRQIGL